LQVNRGSKSDSLALFGHRSTSAGASWIEWLHHPSAGDVLPSELPERYHARRRQSVRLLFAFFAVLIIEAFLLWLDILIFRNPS
jgi:hypothetical protein